MAIAPLPTPVQAPSAAPQVQAAPPVAQPVQPPVSGWTAAHSFAQANPTATWQTVSQRFALPPPVAMKVISDVRGMTPAPVAPPLAPAAQAPPVGPGSLAVGSPQLAAAQNTLGPASPGAAPLNHALAPALNPPAAVQPQTQRVPDATGAGAKQAPPIAPPIAPGAQPQELAGEGRRDEPRTPGSSMLTPPTGAPIAGTQTGRPLAARGGSPGWLKEVGRLAPVAALALLGRGNPGEAASLYDGYLTGHNQQVAVGMQQQAQRVAQEQRGQQMALDNARLAEIEQRDQQEAAYQQGELGRLNAAPSLNDRLIRDLQKDPTTVSAIQTVKTSGVSPEDMALDISALENPDGSPKASNPWFTGGVLTADQSAKNAQATDTRYSGDQKSLMTRLTAMGNTPDELAVQRQVIGQFNRDHPGHPPIPMPGMRTATGAIVPGYGTESIHQATQDAQGAGRLSVEQLRARLQASHDRAMEQIGAENAATGQARENMYADSVTNNDLYRSYLERRTAGTLKPSIYQGVEPGAAWGSMFDQAVALRDAASNRLIAWQSAPAHANMKVPSAYLDQVGRLDAVITKMNKYAPPKGSQTARSMTNPKAPAAAGLQNLGGGVQFDASTGIYYYGGRAVRASKSASGGPV